MSKKGKKSKNEKGALVAIYSTQSKKDGKIYTGFKTGETVSIGLFVCDHIVVGTTADYVKKGKTVDLPKGLKIDKGWIRLG
jgi:hypothetical protein